MHSFHHANRIVLVASLFLTSSSSWARILQLECNAQFQVKTFDKRGFDFDATVPSAPGPSFQSYYLTIDLDRDTASLAIAQGAKAWETYKITVKSNDLIIMEFGQAVGGQSGHPVMFYIRRTSGWFMKQEALEKTSPKVDIVNVGVCGAGPKF